MAKVKATKKAGSATTVSKGNGAAAEPKKKRKRVWVNTMVQLNLPGDVHVDLKTYAANKGLTMIEVVSLAVNWFIETHAAKPTVLYLADTKQFKQRQYWVDKTAYTNSEVASERDRVAIRTVIYTALMFFHDSEVTTDKVFTFPQKDARGPTTRLSKRR